MTLALRLRLALAWQLALGAAVGALLLPGTAPGGPAVHAAAIVIAACACPILFTAVVLACEMAVQTALAPDPPGAGAAWALRVWAGETCTSLRAFCWRQAFRAGDPAPAVTHDPQRPAVLLIHGYLCNRAVWQPLIASGRLAGCNLATIDLAPGTPAIDAHAPALAAAIDRLCAASGAEHVVLVAHSMGGLVAASYLRDRADARVSRVITVATPYAGTGFARLGLRGDARQMRPRAPWLRDLDAGMDASLRARFTCIASRDDNLILPRASAELAGAQARWVERVGHLALLEDPRVWALIATALLEAAGAAPI